jgi:chromosome partitioning protein
MTNTIDRQSLSRVVAVINGKGGVLKTTLTANIGGLLATSGFKVLLVDLDPQGNLAEDLGYTESDYNDDGRALATALSFGNPATPVASVRTNLDVLIGGAALDGATAALAAMGSKNPTGSKLALASLLQPIAADYDMILIDCPPGDETLQTAAVAAARYALVPVKSDKSSRKGLAAVAARLDTVLEVNPGLDLLGVVLVDVGTTATTVQREARQNVTELFGTDESIVFSATIRHSEATAQATRERGMLVHELEDDNATAPKWFEVASGKAEARAFAPISATSVAADLQAVTQELVERITAREVTAISA